MTREYGLQKMENCTDEEFSSMYRMTRPLFNDLLDRISPKLEPWPMAPWQSKWRENKKNLMN